MRRTWSFVAGFLLGWLVIELFASIVGARAPDAIVWHNAAAQKKIQILESDIPALQVVAGTSQVLQGVDPSRLDQPTINVALSGGVPALQQLWLLEDVLPRRQIDRVVWGVNPLVDFGAGSTPAVVRRYVDAPAVDEPLAWTVEDLVSPYSSIARYRRQVSAFGWFRTRAVDADVDARGMRNNFDQTVTRHRRRVWSSLLDGYEFGEVQPFADTVASLRLEPVEIVIVIMPVPNRTVALLPGGAERYGKLVSDVRSVAVEMGATVLEPPPRFSTDPVFLDFSHFSKSANQDFSNWLRTELMLLNEG